MKEMPKHLKEKALENMNFSEFRSADEINAALEENIRNGDIVIVGEENGEPTFKLTEQGRAKAEAIFMAHLPIEGPTQ